MDVNCTIFHQNKVNCFTKHGEEYILLPHLIQTSFQQYSRDQIETACGVLNIKLLLTNLQELNALKSKKVIKQNHDKFIGLIRRSDAERLLKLLNQKGAGEPSKKLLRGRHVPVQHNCFGTQNGTLWPHLYIDLDSGCIVCETCNQLFTPPQFVGHIHKPVETSVVHWGFDSSNWRLYLCVNPGDFDTSTEYSDMDLLRHSELLEECKARHFQKELDRETCSQRRYKLAVWQPSQEGVQLLTEVPPPPPSMQLEESFSSPNGQSNSAHRDRKISLCDSTVPIPCNEAINLPADFVPNISLKGNSHLSMRSYIPEDCDDEHSEEKIAKPGSHRNASALSGAEILYNPAKHYLDGLPKARVATQDISQSERQYTNAQLALVKAIFSIDSNRFTSETFACSPVSRHLLQLYEEVKQSHQAVVAVLQKENDSLRKRLQTQGGQKHGDVSTTQQCQQGKAESHNASNEDTGNSPYLWKLRAKYDANKNELEQTKRELETLKRKSSQRDCPSENREPHSYISPKRLLLSQAIADYPHLMPMTVKAEYAEVDDGAHSSTTTSRREHFLSRTMMVKVSPDSSDVSSSSSNSSGMHKMDAPGAQLNAAVMTAIRHHTSACA